MSATPAPPPFAFRPTRPAVGGDDTLEAGAPAPAAGRSPVAYRPVGARHRALGRLAALLAMLATAAAAVALVERANTTASRGPAPTPRAAAVRVHRPAYYTVRPGDTLSAVATRYRLRIAQLEVLNPGLDPHALSVGQRLRLHGHLRARARGGG